MKFSTALDKEKSRVIVLEYNTGTNLEEMTELFGGEVIREAATDSIIISLQSNVRRWMKAGLTDEQISEKVAAYKPGVRGPRVAKVMTPADMLAAFEKMTDEQKAVILNSLPKA